MCGAVQTCKSPVRIDQTNNKCDTIGRPSGVVDEVGKDESSSLVGGSLCRYGHENDEEGYQGGVEGGCRDRREELAIAIKEEGKNIHNLIADEDMPW